MATYLLLWNPKRYTWDDLAVMSKEVKEGIPIKIRWSCGNSKHIKSGDRIFIKRDGRGRSAISRRLRRLGKDPRGIFASGTVITGSYEDKHWDRTAAADTTMYVEVELDTLLDPESDDILPRELLKSDERFSAMHWDSQKSGVQIPDEIATELEKVWASFATTRGFLLPEEVADTTDIYEGASRKISVNAYERSPKARRKCIEHYGERCYVCGFDFSAKYGEVGKGFIHVHHLIPLSEIGEEYKIDPVLDLRPVCPNCHAIIHKRQPAYSIEEVRAFLREAGYTDSMNRKAHPKLVREIVGGEPYEYHPLGKYIVSAAGVCEGRPTFKYTSIEVQVVLDLLAAGETIEELVRSYQRRISKEAIQEALKLAASSLRREAEAMVA